MFLFNGQIISSKILKMKLLNLNNYKNLVSLIYTTIKKPKIQETSTLKLLNVYMKKQKEIIYCNEQFKKRNITYFK